MAESRPNSLHESQFGHESFIVRLRHPTIANVTVDAIFKPRIEGDGDGWHRAPMEASDNVPLSFALRAPAVTGLADSSAPPPRTKTK